MWGDLRVWNSRTSGWFASKISHPFNWAYCEWVCWKLLALLSRLSPSIKAAWRRIRIGADTFGAHTKILSSRALNKLLWTNLQFYHVQQACGGSTTLYAWSAFHLDTKAKWNKRLFFSESEFLHSTSFLTAFFGGHAAPDSQECCIFHTPWQSLSLLYWF